MRLPETQSAPYHHAVVRLMSQFQSLKPCIGDGSLHFIRLVHRIFGNSFSGRPACFLDYSVRQAWVVLSWCLRLVRMQAENYTPVANN